MGLSISRSISRYLYDTFAIGPLLTISTVNLEEKHAWSVRHIETSSLLPSLATRLNPGED